MHPFSLDDLTPVPPNYPEDSSARRRRVAPDHVIDFRDDETPIQPIRRRGLFTVLVVASALSSLGR